MDVSMSNQIEDQPKTMCSPGEETTLKVRKPYTISKQREKWTDEEHNKFLEALKLHGRAWRKIEEHIGTKTTVQIRSHAQKFFSKVMRESAGGNCEAMKLVDIPPPRPKRKPLHPYPRKSGSVPDKTLPVLKKLDKSLMNLEYVSDQENRSPTSVLSTVVSSNACARDLYDYGRDSAAMEDMTKFQLPSALGEYGSRIYKGKSAMEVDTSDSKEKKMESEAPVTSLKLFGTTVIIDDARKSTSCFTGSAKHCEKRCDNLVPQPHDEQVQGDAGKDVRAPVLPDGDCVVPGEGSWNPWHCGMPSMFYCFPPQQEHKIVPDTMASIQVPTWALYRGLTTFPFLHPLSFAPCCSEDVFQKEEGSQSASNEGPDMEARSTSNDAKPSSDDKARGFMPYKRCLAEREAEQANSNKTGEDR